jgi:GAF domain-containing protein
LTIACDTLESAVLVNTVSDPPSAPWEQPAGRVEEALVKTARTLTSHFDIDGVCRSVLDGVEDVFNADSSWVLLYDAGSKKLRTVSSRGRGSEVFRDLSITPDVGIVGLAFTTRKVVFVADVQRDGRWFDAARVHLTPLQSVFAVPLMSGDEALGVVGMEPLTR